MQITLPTALTSKKLWAAILLAVLGVFNAQVFHLPPDTFNMIAAAVIAYILGQAYVDGATKN